MRYTLVLDQPGATPTDLNLPAISLNAFVFICLALDQPSYACSPFSGWRFRSARSDTDRSKGRVRYTLGLDQQYY